MSKSIYRILFFNADHTYEIYAKAIMVESPDFIGFVEVSELLFNDKQQLVLDPSEEKLKQIFKSVKRTFIPLHSIIRIDEVEHGGLAKVKSVDKNSTNVMPFPQHYMSPKKDKTDD